MHDRVHEHVCGGRCDGNPCFPYGVVAVVVGGDCEDRTVAGSDARADVVVVVDDGVVADGVDGVVVVVRDDRMGFVRAGCH